MTSSVSSSIPALEMDSDGESESAAVRVSTRTGNTSPVRARKAKSCYLTQDTSSLQRVCGFSRLPDSCPPSKCNNEISAQAYVAAQCDETLLRQQGNIYFISWSPLL